MKPSTIVTFCRWWSRTAGRTITPHHFLHHAMSWKFGAVDEMQLKYVIIAWNKSGHIPEFAKEYWRYRVLPFISIKGGGNGYENLPGR